MSSRKPAKPIYAFHRFLESIYRHYIDKGFNKKSAKTKMYQEVYNTSYELYKDDKDIPDEVLVVTLQHASRILNNRGAKLTKELQNSQEGNINHIRKPIHEIKEVKDVVDKFISTYKGVESDE